MTTVYFKQTPTGTVKSFSAVYLEEFYDDSDKTEYTDIGFTKHKVVHQVHKAWKIILGFISTDADIDWLATLRGYTYPQISFNGSTYYDVIINAIEPEKIGTTMTVIKQVAGF